MPSAPIGMPAMPGQTSAPAGAAQAAAPSEETNTDLQDAIAIISENSDKEVKRACLTLLVKMTENIEKNPVEPKFRKIKTANGAFSKKVVACNGGVEVMLAAGWMP